MGDKFTICIERPADMPPGVHGAVAATGTGYIILLNPADTPARQLAAFLHEMTHLYNQDLTSGRSVGEIEARTRRQLQEALETIRQEEEPKG